MVCVPQTQVAVRPENMSATVGAAIPVNYLTAYQLVCVMGGLRAGETMLVPELLNMAFASKSIKITAGNVIPRVDSS